MQSPNRHARAERWCRAAVAERLADATSTHSEFEQPAGQGIGFYTGEDGFLYCDSLKVDDIRDQVCPRHQGICKGRFLLYLPGA